MGKLKLRIKDFKDGTATKDLEQSKTPKEEQCYCLRYGSPMPLGLPSCPMHAKTEDTGECKGIMWGGKAHVFNSAGEDVCSENKEESMEDRFDKKYGIFVDHSPVGEWEEWEDGRDYAPTVESIKQFISQEISKAVAKERESIIEDIESYFDQYRSSSEKKNGKRIFGVANFEIGMRHTYDNLLSLLNSKKGQHG